MRPWLLLASLLVSDLSSLGDGDWIMENYSWSLRRKLLLNGQMTPLGLEILQTQTEHHCMRMQRKCVCVAVQHKQRTSHFYWAYTVHDAHGCSLCLQEFTRIIHRNHIPAPVASLLVPAFLVKSDTLPALHVINEITPTKAAGEAGHVAATDVIKDRPGSGSARPPHGRTAAPGHDFKALTLEKSKSWSSVQLHEMLTKRYRAATAVILSRCLKEGEKRSAMNIKKISKQQIAQPLIRLKESTQRAMDIKVLMRPSKASISRHDIFKAATLHCSSSEKTDISQLKIQGNAVRIMRKNEHLNLDGEHLLQKSVQRQRSLKAASSVHGEDGFHVERQRLLVSTQKTEPINRPRYNIRDGNKEDFSGKIITKQAELRRPEGESETQQSHINTVENGNQKRLASILQAGFTHKGDNKDVGHKQTLTEVREEVLIMLFLPDTERETQTQPSSRGKLILKKDTGWIIVKTPIKELGDPPPMTKVTKENFITEADNAKCKCLKEVLLEMHVLNREERRDIKPAERKVYTEKQVKDTTEHSETNSAPHENTCINHTKQEENMPQEESTKPSPPSLKMMDTETAKAGHTAETTTVNMEIKETTSSTEVFNQGSAQKADGLPTTEETPAATAGPESETDAEPRFITCRTGSTQAPAEKSFSGLRMREDFPALSVTNRPETERKATDEPPKTTGDNMPLCRGLIHRTEAGRRHCAERFAGMGSETFSSDAFKDTGGQEKEHTSIREHKDKLLRDDEYDHFYYFDGVLRRVQNNSFPYRKRQRRRKRSHDGTENSAFKVRERGENLLSYIRRLTLRKRAGRFK